MVQYNKEFAEGAWPPPAASTAAEDSEESSVPAEARHAGHSDRAHIAASGAQALSASCLVGCRAMMIFTIDATRVLNLEGEFINEQLIFKASGICNIDQR